MAALTSPDKLDETELSERNNNVRWSFQQLGESIRLLLDAGAVEASRCPCPSVEMAGEVTRGGGGSGGGGARSGVLDMAWPGTTAICHRHY